MVNSGTVCVYLKRMTMNFTIIRSSIISRSPKNRQIRVWHVMIRLEYHSLERNLSITIDLLHLWNNNSRNLFNSGHGSSGLIVLSGLHPEFACLEEKLNQMINISGTTWSERSAVVSSWYEVWFKRRPQSRRHGQRGTGSWNGNQG